MSKKTQLNDGEDRGKAQKNKTDLNLKPPKIRCVGTPINIDNHYNIFKKTSTFLSLIKRPFMGLH